MGALTVAASVKRKADENFGAQRPTFRIEE